MKKHEHKYIRGKNGNECEICWQLKSTIEYMKKERKTEVNIREVGGGYLIEVEDEFIKNSFAITKSELEKIVLYGKKILKDN